MNRRQRKEFLESMRVKASVAVAMPPKEKPMVREYKIGRNDKCPCGSEIKYKNCCLNKGKFENYVTK